MIFYYLAATPPVNQPICTISSLQTPRNNRFCSALTLARPPTTKSLIISDRSFQYASPHLYNQLPASLREPVSPLHASQPIFMFSTFSIHPFTLNSKLTFSVNPFHHRHSRLTFSANGTVFCFYSDHWVSSWFSAVD